MPHTAATVDFEGFFVHRRIRLHAASTVGLAARAAAGIPAVREPGTVTLMGSCGGSHPSADLRPDEVSAAIVRPPLGD